MIAGEQYGAPEDGESIGRLLAQRLREQGAEVILEQLASCQ